MISKLFGVVITHYCNCVKCCGKNPGDPAYGITADGSTASWGTVAADWSKIPQGHYVRFRVPGHADPYIAGKIFVGQVQDKGGAIKGMRLDIWRNTHHAALQGGKVEIAEVEVSPILPPGWGEADGYK